MEGTKLPEHLECPLDSLIYRAASPIVDIAHSWGLTPNALTFLSFICTIASLRAFSHGAAGPAALFWAASYLLDCCDGLEARRYDMETVIGSIADHVTDLVGYLGFVAIAATKIQGPKSAWPLIASIVFGLCATYHLQCQQLYDAGRNAPIEGLDRLPMRCTRETDLHLTRFVGVGTANLVILLCIFYYCAKVWPPSRR